MVTAGKTYSNTAASDEDKPLLLISSGNDDFLNDDSSEGNPVTVTITAITSTTIEGTFKGDLVATLLGNGDSPATKTVTDGKFFVAFSK